MSNLNEIDQLVLRAQGIKGIKNELMSEGLIYLVKKFRKHFGIDMEMRMPYQVVAASEWIEKYDKKFKSHIMNPYERDKAIAGNRGAGIINEKFIVKLRNDTYMYVSGHVPNKVSTDSDNIGNTLFIYIFGKKCFHYFNELKKYMKDNAKGTNLMYSITGSDDGNGRSRWSVTATTMEPRPMDTIFLDGNIKQEITDHLDKWLQNEDIYKKRGLTFKTGILLYGIPGTGKSSLATAIATYLDCSLITIDTTKFQYLNISEISDSINADDDRYVVLIDEVDTIFTSRDKEDASDKEIENTSKLLSFLDSPQSPSNVVFVCTTNYYERLDKALVRRGRINLEENLTDISFDTAQKMCYSFDLGEDKTNELFARYRAKGITKSINPSSLQNDILDMIDTRIDEDE